MGGESRSLATHFATRQLPQRPRRHPRPPLHQGPLRVGAGEPAGV